MKFLAIRPNFWININHITNIWLDADRNIRFQLSSDCDGSENVLRTPEERAILCRATRFPNPDLP